jgi:hypothetical protein
MAERPVVLPPVLREEQAMAAIYPIFGNASFDPEAMRVMGEAFDKACDALNWTQRSPVLNEGLANRIIGFAREGERDADRLCSRALEALGVILR